MLPAPSAPTRARGKARARARSSSLRSRTLMAANRRMAASSVADMPSIVRSLRP
jgi:hypothetical protein